MEQSHSPNRYIKNILQNSKLINIRKFQQAKNKRELPQVDWLSSFENLMVK